MIKLLHLSGIAASLLVATMSGLTGSPLHAAVTTFRGIDIAAGGGAHPNSDAARAAFLSHVVQGTVGMEDFEKDALGSFLAGSRTVDFVPSAIEGTLQNLATTTAEIVTATAAGYGIPISGTQVVAFATTGDSEFFRLTLSTPRTAFAFFGSSFSDYANISGGPFPAIRVSLDGGTPIDVVDIDPSNIPGGSVNFFGVISDTHFSAIRLINPIGTTDDGVGLDDLMVAQAIAIPEPSIWVTLVAGLLLVAARGAARRPPEVAPD